MGRRRDRRSSADLPRTTDVSSFGGSQWILERASRESLCKVARLVRGSQRRHDMRSYGRLYRRCYGDVRDGRDTTEFVQYIAEGLWEKFINGMFARGELCFTGIIVFLDDNKKFIPWHFFQPDPNVLEAETPQGLIRGHAYSITRVKYVDISTPNQTGKIPLVRLRNPWGNEAEWNGPWSDQ